jgi:hypothetical protein
LRRAEKIRPVASS